MNRSLGGRAFVFGDNLNSDVIIPGRYLVHIDPETLSQHAFEVLGDEFPDRLRAFEVIVAGVNFGCGSAREQAATALVGLGIKAVVARSFARAFYRNAINSGLPIVECPELVDHVREGDQIDIDLAAGQVSCRGRSFGFPQLPDSLRAILESGGLAAYLKSYI